jgi:heme exporter protein D
MNPFFEWLAMGGYSIYVWPAYGLVCVVLVMNLLGMKWKRKQTRLKLQQWFKR